MNAKPTPMGVAVQSLVICLAVCGLVIAMFFLFGDAAKAHDPVRLGIILFVLIAVPIGNYFGAKRRQRSRAR
jgi:hypothetical protein